MIHVAAVFTDIHPPVGEVSQGAEVLNRAVVDDHFVYVRDVGCGEGHLFFPVRRNSQTRGGDIAFPVLQGGQQLIKGYRYEYKFYLFVVFNPFIDFFIVRF